MSLLRGRQITFGQLGYASLLHDFPCCRWHYRWMLWRSTHGTSVRNSEYRAVATMQELPSYG